MERVRGGGMTRMGDLRMSFIGISVVVGLELSCSIGCDCVGMESLDSANFCLSFLSS